MSGGLNDTTINALCVCVPRGSNSTGLICCGFAIAAIVLYVTTRCKHIHIANPQQIEPMKFEPVCASLKSELSKAKSENGGRGGEQNVYGTHACSHCTHLVRCCAAPGTTRNTTSDVTAGSVYSVRFRKLLP